MMRGPWTRLALVAAAALSTACRAYGSPAASERHRTATAGSPAMTTAHRTTGVVPLFVFFDAVDEVARSHARGVAGTETTFEWRSGVVQPTDKEGTHYSWDFGDPGAGAWVQTGLSKNTATGYTTGHVYEAPGTFTVTLTVTQTNGEVSTYAQTITVRAFAGETRYLASDGQDGRNGTEARPWRTLAKGAAWVTGAPNRRLLLRRGDVFTTPGISISRRQGAGQAGILAAYGTGARPVVRSDGTGSAVELWGVNDWKVVDLSVVGPGMDVATDTGGIEISGAQTTDSLVMRCTSTAFRTGFGNSQSANDAVRPHDANAWVENEVGGGNKAGNMYVGGRRLAILGNHLHDQPNTHLLRTYQVHKGVIAHNRLFDPGPTRGALKLGGMTHGTAWPRTYYVTVSDNLIRGHTWSMSIGPQNTEEDERLAHLVVERNRFWGAPSVQADVVIEARHVMVRNNVFDATGAYKSYRAVFLMTRHRGPGLDTVRVLHNTVVRRDASPDAVWAAEFESTTEDTPNVTLANNIVYAPRTANVALYGGKPGSGFTQGNNLVGVDPAFVDALRGDYELAARSPAVDAAATRTDVREDVRRTRRPRGAAPDIGAYESH